MRWDQFQSQYQLTNSDLHSQKLIPMSGKNDTTEKIERATPMKTFRPVTPKITATCLPLPEAPLKPKNNAPSVPVREDIPWPSAGKMFGKSF